MEETLAVESRRSKRMKRVQLVQHLGAAALLVLTGAAHLREGHAAEFLPLLEVLAGVLLIGSVARERWRAARGHHHDGVAWVEIAGAGLMLVEAFARTRGHHHTSFIILSFVAPLVVLTVGLLDVSRRGQRFLKADDEAVVVRLRLLFRRRFPFAEMRSFRRRGAGLDLQLTGGGTRRLSVSDVVDRDAALIWLSERLRARGIEELSTGELPGGEGSADEGEGNQELVLSED